MIHEFFLYLASYQNAYIQAWTRQVICIKLIEPAAGYPFYKTMHLHRFLAAALGMHETAAYGKRCSFSLSISRRKVKCVFLEETNAARGL